MNNPPPPKSSSSPSGSSTRKRQLQVKGATKPKPKRLLPNPVQVNLYAQKLNNSAAFCIEIGQYDRATVSLAKALRLLDLHKDHELEDACQCQDCTIEGCISYSQKLPTSAHAAILACSHKSKKQKTAATQPQHEQQEQQAATKTSLFKSHFWKPEEPETSTDGKAQPSTGSVYRRPIQVCPRTLREGHNMGSTLILIVVFNLALAHHCSILSHSKQQQHNSSCTSTEDEQRQGQRRAKLQTTLKLYDLADSWYSKHKMRRHRQYNSNSHTDPFGMILCNNLCHIHRSLNDPAKHQESLQRLTSALMIAVDHKKTNTAVVEQVQEAQAIQEQQSQDVDDTSTTRDNNHNNHLEGFLQTASQLILRNKCADAA